MRLVLIILLIIGFSLLLGYILSELTGDVTERAGITYFSVETKAVCEELKERACYYRCHDETFLIIGGKESSISKSNEFVCHDEDWVDPRSMK